MNREVNPEIAEILKSMPFLEPEDVAGAVLYVLSTPPHVQVKIFAERFLVFQWLFQIHELTIQPVGEKI